MINITDFSAYPNETKYGTKFNAFFSEHKKTKVQLFLNKGIQK